MYSEKNADNWCENASSAEIKNFLYSLTTAEAACIYTGMSLDLSKVPQLFADGYVIPKEGFDVIKSGNYNMVPMMFGSVTNEFAYYALSAVYANSDTELNVIDTGWEMLEIIKAAKNMEVCICHTTVLKGMLRHLQQQAQQCLYIRTDLTGGIMHR